MEIANFGPRKADLKAAVSSWKENLQDQVDPSQQCPTGLTSLQVACQLFRKLANRAIIFRDFGSQETKTELARECFTLLLVFGRAISLGPAPGEDGPPAQNRTRPYGWVVPIWPKKYRTPQPRPSPPPSQSVLATEKKWALGSPAGES